jgi:hypothetical protein
MSPVLTPVILFLFPRSAYFAAFSLLMLQNMSLFESLIDQMASVPLPE